MFKKIAKFSYRHRLIVCLVWIGLLFGILFWAHTAGNAFSSDFKLNGTDSQASIDLLNQKFPSQSGSTGDIVFKSNLGIYDPSTKAQIDNLLSQVSKVGQVVSIRSPYSAQSIDQVSANGKIAYASVRFNGIVTQVTSQTINTIQSKVKNAETSNLQIEMGGDVFSTFRPQLTSEAIGITAAIVILIFAFGSIIATGLPIIIALTGIGVGISIIELMAHIVTLPDFATELGAMLGIGVGIDYALLIVTRYRQNIANKLSPEAATINAINTAGRSVFFAGTAVVVSLLGMLLMNVGFIQSLGVASAIVVTITMLAAITLLPAIFGFIGTKIDAIKIPKIGGSETTTQLFWHRWSRFVLRNPWKLLVLGVAALAVLAIPFFSMRLGSSDSSSHPTSDTTRRAYDLLSEGFGVGSNGPLLIAANISGPQDFGTITELQRALQQTSGVSFVSPPQPNKQMDAVTMQVIPTTSPQDSKTADLITNIRTSIIPDITSGTDVQVHVGGVTATFADLAARLQGRLPIFFVTVLGVSFILLLLVFRSVLIPLKAVVMNVLSIGAAYGVITAVFQWGWLKSVVGVGLPGPIDSYVPMMMFAIVFGLSMDYEVFLLSRIKEEYDKTHNNEQAVTEGLAKTAKVITTAALIMVTVFACFIITDLRVLKEFGLGLSVAIFLDASVVRLIVVPVVMKLLGKANWWFPGWLKWLPEFQIDDVHK